MTKHYLRIDIVSDVVCPWCVIGFQRLQQALAKFPGQFDLKIVWHPFELNPQMPHSGENLREHITDKYRISDQESAENRDRLTEIGRELGFTFNFTDEMRIYNTNQAHRLLHWAEPTGHQTDLQIRLFEDYFTNGKNLNHEEVLLDAVETVGLNRTEASQALQDKAIAGQTQAREEQLLLQGIRGVPLFMFNHEHAINGAQEVSAFEALLQQLTESAS